MNITKDEISDDDLSLSTIYQLATLVIYQKIHPSLISLKTSLIPSYRIILRNVGSNQKISKMPFYTSHGKRPITTDIILQYIASN